MLDNSAPLASLVRRLSLHAALSPQDCDSILALPCPIRKFDASSYLVREAELPDQCAVLLSGYAYRHKSTAGGARQIVSIHVPGDALDFQNLYLDEADHNVQTLTRVEAAIIPRTAIRELMLARPTVAQAIVVSILVEASIFREWVLNVGRRTARERVAHLLCEFAVRLDAQGLVGSHGYALPMSQEQIGDATGLTAVHVNRMLKILQAEGLVERDKRAVTFPNLDGLREVADFNERYLHLCRQVA
jgi:CRP-like cAMP-binding protein